MNKIKSYFLKAKNKLKTMMHEVMYQLKKALVFCAKLALAITIMTSLMVLVVKAPELHGLALRSYAGPKIYMIKDKKNGGGGTGFAIKAPSGISYILTNAHVCGVSADDEVLVEDSDGEFMQRKIIQRSGDTDLCLIEGMPGVKGLSLGSAPRVGQIVSVVGHPKLQPLTVSRGEIIGAQPILVMDHIMNPEDPLDKCDLPKNKIEEAQVFIFQLKICLIKVNAYLSNAIILPGNSGSPVLDIFANVVAVAFASDNDSHWGALVDQPSIAGFLKKY